MTYSDPSGLICPNLLQQQFHVPEPNRAGVSDLTYIPTDRVWLYLCVVLDLFSRKIVGWSMQNSLSSTLTVQTLKMANEQRRPERGLIFHSDNALFQTQLSRAGFHPSMGRTGNCYDKAVAESFFGSLKIEEVNDNRYRTQESAKNAIFAYIEGFHNRTRRHSFLNNLSPEEFGHAQFT